MRSAWLAWALLIAGWARAESPPPQTVHLFVVGIDRANVQPLVDVFSRHDSNLRLTHVPVFSAAEVMASDERMEAARVWVEVAAGGRARITIADGRAQRFLVRDVVLPTWPDELARETIAQMVESSVAALLENQGLGMTRAEARSILAAHDAVPPPPPRSDYHLGVGAFYQAQLFAPQIPFAHGPGLRAQLGTSTRLGPVGVALSTQYVLPHNHIDANAGVHLQGLAVRTAMGLTRQRPRLHLGAWLGAGVDAIQMRPQQGNLGVASLTAARWTAHTVVRAEIRAGLRISQSVTMTLTPSLEWNPLPRAYTVNGVDGRAAVVDPHALRPGFSFALEWP